MQLAYAEPVREEWPFIGRAGELSEVDRIVSDDGNRGVVFVGPAGVGKTRLATESLAHAKRAGYATIRATATRTAGSIPFGAVATLLPATADLPVTDNRAEMIRRMSLALIEAGAPKPLALLIDDAQLLDDGTATLVHQLASTGAALVLLTVRTGEPAPDAVRALWKDGLAERIEVGGLSVDGATQMLSAALNGPVDRGTVGRLVVHTGGNTLFLRELVLGALQDGGLQFEAGLWRQVQPLRPSDRLVELMEARLEGLGRDERAVLELLAFGEPIGRSELETLAAPGQAEELERSGLLVSELSGSRLLLRAAHPLYAEVLRTTTPAVRAAAVTRSLAEAVERTGARRREDTLRIATWRLDAGGASPAIMLEAAHAARWSYDFELAARLASAAVDAGGGFEAKLFAVQVAILRGRSAEAEGELCRLAAEAGDDAQRAIVTVTQLDNLAFNLARVDDALALAERAEQDIDDPRWRDAVEAKRASLLLVAPSGGPRDAAQAAAGPAASSNSIAKVWGCFTASISLTRIGRMQEALQMAADGQAAHAHVEQTLEWAPWIHEYSHGEALAQLGRFDEADAVATQQYEEGIAGGSLERQAIFAWQLATRVGERGDVRSAIQRSLEASGLYDQLGKPFFVRHCLVHLALALALADEADSAARTLARLDAMDLSPRLFAYSGDLLQARAWTAVAQGDLSRARGFLEEGLAFGEATGDLIGQATALHGLARLGQSRRVAGRLAAVAQHVEGPLVATRAAHATALARGHAIRLRAASEAFAEMGATLLAAEAAADEAAVLERAGDERGATAAQHRARGLAAQCGGAITPALRKLGGADTLTGAERRVGRLAALGRTNREIAEEFHVSVRTVEHQLQRVYEKLGVSGRRDLAAALGVGDGATS